MERLPIIVIGAGVSGLTAVKACLEEKLPVICLELSDSIGGLWKYRENGMSCMKSTFLNTSKEWTAFSDFIVPDDFPNYLSNALYLEYLAMYATKFNLLPHVRLEHKVVWVSKMSNYEITGHWEVKVRNKENLEEILVASAVMICTGTYSQPNIPKIPGLETFKGIVMHSKDYKTPHGMENKNVVVIGSGNTAGDVAVEIGAVASKAYLAIHRGTLHLSRIGHGGMPFDIAALSRYNLWKGTHFKSEETTISQISKAPSLQVDRNLYNLQLEGFKSCVRIPLFNDQLPLSIINGSIAIKNPVHHFTKDGVVFEGEENKNYPIDAVVLATGFQLSMKGILDENAVSREHLIKGLYRRVFPINLTHPTLAFIGCCLKYNGSNSQAAELHSRWAVQVFAKKLKLPPLKSMKNDLKAYEKLLSTTDGSAQSFAVVPFYPYVDEVANEFGSKPNLIRLLFNDPKLFWACAFGPCVAYQYRLNGPHPWLEARKAILTVQDRVRAPFKTRPDIVNLTNGDSQKTNLVSYLILASAITTCAIYGIKYLNRIQTINLVG